MQILVLEDDPKLAQLLTRGFKENHFEVTHLASGAKGVELLKKETFDFVILDLMLPEMNGLQVLDFIETLPKKPKVVILSAKGTVEDRITGLKRGADDYLVKPFAFQELLVRIEVISRRGTALSPAPAELVSENIKLNLLERSVLRSGVRIELQTKEFELLEYFMKNQGKVLTKTLILKEVWGYEFDPQTNIVDVVIFRLRSKIDKDFDPKLIQTIRGVGYRFGSTEKAP